LNYTRTLFTALVCILTLQFSGCDSPPGDVDPTRSASQLQSAIVKPDSISFRNISSRYDTTVTISVNATITDLGSESNPSYVIKNAQDSIVSRGALEPADSADTYQATTDIVLSTSTFTTLYTYIYSDEPSSDGAWIQKKMAVTGLSGSPPEILWATNPDTVQKPESGDRPVIFRAKVTDPDGQDNISIAAFELIRNNEVIQIIELFDDGSAQSGDQTARDSVYTQVLSINDSNEAATYDIHYYAVDKAQLVSDTVKTTFTISN
jgi:hypothetical protein